SPLQFVSRFVFTLYLPLSASTLFPYTTLFRSGQDRGVQWGSEVIAHVGVIEPSCAESASEAVIPGGHGQCPSISADGWTLPVPEIGRAHVWTPVTFRSRMPSSARKKKEKVEQG